MKPSGCRLSDFRWSNFSLYDLSNFFFWEHLHYDLWSSRSDCTITSSNKEQEQAVGMDKISNKNRIINFFFFCSEQNQIDFFENTFSHLERRKRRRKVVKKSSHNLFSLQHLLLVERIEKFFAKLSKHRSIWISSQFFPYTFNPFKCFLLVSFL